MAVNINIENKKKPEIKVGSIVFLRACTNDTIRMVIKDCEKKQYKLLDLKTGYAYAEENTIEELIDLYDLELATNDMTVILHDVED